jgi:hypothetical protein
MTSISLKSTGKCAPGSNLYTYNAVLKNTGGAYVPSSGAYGPMAFISEKVLWSTPTPNKWEGRQSQIPSMAAGGTAVVTISIPYFSANPAYMTAVPSRPFLTGVFRAQPCTAAGCVQTWGPTVTVPAPKGCP